ncbi:AraC family transcriptional regulator [Nocardiopsis oceani]
MDLLSDVVESMRAGTPGGARVEVHGSSWGWWMPGDPDVAGFLAVLGGGCWMFPEDGGPPERLGPGDVVLSPHGGGYGLGDTPDPPTETLEEARPDTGGGFGRHSLGALGAPAVPGAGPSTVLVCGGYRMDRERTHPLLSALPEHVRVRTSEGREPRLERVLAVLGEETATARPGADALVALLLDALLLYTLRACLEEGAEGEAPDGWARALADPGVGAALAAVHGDPARPWTVAALAAAARMSRATFARRFTALAGQPPMAYVAWWRLNTARGLLRDTDLPVEAVAARVGYTSPFAFSRAFRSAYGAAPGRYRRSLGTEVTAFGSTPVPR